LCRPSAVPLWQCFTSTSNNIGFLLLCEVALGEMNLLKNAQYMDKAPGSCLSTKGLGTSAPDPAGSLQLDNGCVVPAGKIVRTDANSSLLYNEFIVYDVSGRGAAAGGKRTQSGGAGRDGAGEIEMDGARGVQYSGRATGRAVSDRFGLGFGFGFGLPVNAHADLLPLLSDQVSQIRMKYLLKVKFNYKQRW